MLAGSEATAAARGWTTLRLETGPRQPEAIGLHERSGHRPTGAFGQYLDEPDEWSRYDEEQLPGPPSGTG